jgi:hypothetical protein
VVTLGALFSDEPQPVCADAADADDDGSLSITDAIYTLDCLFLGGPRPLRRRVIAGRIPRLTGSQPVGIRRTPA